MTTQRRSTSSYSFTKAITLRERQTLFFWSVARKADAFRLEPATPSASPPVCHCPAWAGAGSGGFLGSTARCPGVSSALLRRCLRVPTANGFVPSLVHEGKEKNTPWQRRRQCFWRREMSENGGQRELIVNHSFPSIVAAGAAITPLVCSDQGLDKIAQKGIMGTLRRIGVAVMLWRRSSVG